MRRFLKASSLRAGALIAFAVGAVLTACSGNSGPDGTGNGSCSLMEATASLGSVVPVGATEVCLDFGPSVTDTAATQACSTAMGTYSATASCPSANRVGRCEESAKSSSGETAALTVNFYPPTAASDIQSACNMENGMNGVTATYTAN